MNRRRRRLITPPNRQVVPRKLMKFCVSTAFLPRWINECVATCFHLTKLINSAFALSFFVCFHLTRPGPRQRSGFRVTTHEQHIHNRYFTVLLGGSVLAVQWFIPLKSILYVSDRFLIAEKWHTTSAARVIIIFLAILSAPRQCALWRCDILHLLGYFVTPA